MTDELDDLEALAADYVLGTLDHAERRRAEAMLAQDHTFARMVDDWTKRLAPLSEAVPPIEPSPEVWRRIQSALPTASRQRAIRSGRVSFWQRIDVWRWWAAAASAVAAALALYIAVTPPGLAPETRYMAVLNAGEANPAWLVTVDIAAQRMTIRPLAEVAAADKSYELWMVPDAETPPQSLGLLSPERQVSIPISAETGAAVPRAAALAVSLEPLGGSPTGLPTGPVLYQGPILTLEQ